MESVSSTLSSSQLPPQSPFDPYRDHFDPRRDAGHEHPESWSSGGNNSNSPLGQFNNNDMDENGDVSMHGIHSGEGSTAHEPKRNVSYVLIARGPLLEVDIYSVMNDLVQLFFTR